MGLYICAHCYSGSTFNVLSYFVFTSFIDFSPPADRIIVDVVQSDDEVVRNTIHNR